MSDNPLGVRRADHNDYEPLCDLVLHLASEDALQPISEEKVRLAVQRCIERDGAIAGIIDGAEGIQATVGLMLDRLPLCDDDYLATRWMGTSASYRERMSDLLDQRRKRGWTKMPDDFGLLTRLVRFAKWVSEKMDCPLIISVLTVRDTEVMLSSYQRQAPQVGAMFGWGGLLDRAFLNQARDGGRRKRGEVPRGAYASGRVRQPSPSPAVAATDNG